MQEEELGRTIRGLQKEKRRKHQRGGSTKVRVSFSGNPNGASDSEQDVNVNKRASHSDGESQPDKVRKRSRSERSGGVQAYDSPSNKAAPKYQNQNQYETGYIGGKEPKKGKGEYKGCGKHKGGNQKRRGEAQDTSSHPQTAMIH